VFLNPRIFKRLCNEKDHTQSYYIVPILHTEVRCLSPGLVLSTVFELHAEIEIFLREHISHLSKQFSARNFNELNMQMRGRSVTVVDARDQIQSFQLIF